MSEARREVLRATDEDMATLLEKAGLAGANILCLIVALGVGLEEPALALSNSFVEYNSQQSIRSKKTPLPILCIIPVVKLNALSIIAKCNKSVFLRALSSGTYGS